MSQIDNKDNSGVRKPLEAELLDPGEDGPARGSSNRRGGEYGGGMSQNTIFRRSWIYSPVDMSGCSSPFVTLVLFLIMLGQYGLLAAIGFFVFYLCGSVIGSLRMTRQLVLGLPPNPWGWRIGNWVVSFLLTVWLAGGFKQ